MTNASFSKQNAICSYYNQQTQSKQFIGNILARLTWEKYKEDKNLYVYEKTQPYSLKLFCKIIFYFVKMNMYWNSVLHLFSTMSNDANENKSSWHIPCFKICIWDQRLHQNVIHRKPWCLFYFPSQIARVTYSYPAYSDWLTCFPPSYI